MFELVCAVFGETRALLWLGGVSLAAKNPKMFGEFCSLFWIVVRSRNSWRGFREGVTRVFANRDGFLFGNRSLWARETPSPKWWRVFIEHLMHGRANRGRICHSQLDGWSEAIWGYTNGSSRQNVNQEGVWPIGQKGSSGIVWCFDGKLVTLDSLWWTWNSQTEHVQTRSSNNRFPL